MIATPPKYPVLTDSSARTGLLSENTPMAAKAAKPHSRDIRQGCPCPVTHIARLHLLANLHALSIPVFASEYLSGGARGSVAFIEPDDVFITLPERAGYRQVAVNLGVVHICALRQKELSHLKVIFLARHHQGRNARLVVCIIEGGALPEQELGDRHAAGIGRRVQRSQPA